MGKTKIDGFIDPGHVSAIIGTEPYKSMKVPQVITGFKPEDVLEGIEMLLEQIKNNKAEVENQYVRAVKKEGNPTARKITFDVFEIVKFPAGDHNAGYWRGFGFIPDSGLEIKNKYEKFNAKVKYKNILDKIDFSKSKDLAGCKCDEIIRGLKTPDKCPMFGKACTPENPYGPCMVSVEGACSNFFREMRK